VAGQNGTPPAKLALALRPQDKHTVKEICQMMGIFNPTLYNHLAKTNSDLVGAV
jgi:hypothetical protein